MTDKIEGLCIFMGRDEGETRWLCYGDGEIRTYRPGEIDPRLMAGKPLEEITDPAALSGIHGELPEPVIVPVRVALAAFPGLSPEKFADLPR